MLDLNYVTQRFRWHDYVMVYTSPSNIFHFSLTCIATGSVRQAAVFRQDQDRYKFQVPSSSYLFCDLVNLHHDVLDLDEPLLFNHHPREVHST